MNKQTDGDFKKALAQLAPLLVEIDADNGGLFWTKDPFMLVDDTQFFYICWLLEGILNEDDQEKYEHELSQIIPQNLNCGPSGDLEPFDIMVHREFDLLHATWQQRVEALAIVKGIWKRKCCERDQNHDGNCDRHPETP